MEIAVGNIYAVGLLLNQTAELVEYTIFQSLNLSPAAVTTHWGNVFLYFKGLSLVLVPR